jgi:sugar lactone lactonase YvrE
MPQAMIDCPCAQASFAEPSGLCLSPDRRRLYVADRASSAIRVIHLAAAMVETVAGAHFQGCMDVTLSPAGIVVADTENHALRGINPRHSTVVTLWQGKGPGQRSQDHLARPAGVAFDRVDRTYVVADTHNHRIMRVARDAAWARAVELVGVPAPR